MHVVDFSAFLRVTEFLNSNLTTFLNLNVNGFLEFKFKI